jgi:hypothetical protein
MSALGTIQAFNENTGPIGRGRVAADTIIYKGAMIARGLDGFLVPFATGLFFAGHAQETVDNSGGAAGAKWVDYRRGTYYVTVPVFASITIAHIGDPVWAVTDNHADLTKTDPGTTLTTTDLVAYIHNVDDVGNVQLKFMSRNN